MAKKVTPKNWDIKKDISVTELILDVDNIRLPIKHKTQDAIVQDLFSNEDAMDILKSIHKNGLFPDELPVVIQEKGKYIVLEGNRRVSALKAIIEPRLVPSSEKAIRALKIKSIKKINVVIAPSREAAKDLIASKHTHNTRKPWKPLRQAYFYKSLMDNGKTVAELKADYPEHDIEKFIRMLEVYHVAKSISYSGPEITAKVHDDRKFPITNLERMYDDKNIRDFLGFDFDSNGKLVGKIDVKEFQKGLSKVVEDVATGEIDSRKYNTEGQRKDYIKKFPKQYTPNKNKKAKFSAKNFKEQSLPSPKPKKNASTQKGLIPAYVTFGLQNSSLKEIYTELKTIKVADFPNATHDLLRSFLECSLVTYFKVTNEYSKIAKNSQHNPKLSELLTFAASNNCTSLSDANLKQVLTQIKANYSENYSLERMNMINHNENWHSVERDVRGAWGRLESLMKIILNPQKKK